MSFMATIATMTTMQIVLMAISLACTIISMGMSIYAMLTAKSPKPAVPAPNAVSGVPTAEQGKPIPVIFGTCTVTQSNVVWWGNPHQIKNNVKM